MCQITFACQQSFEKFARKSRREEFLQTMESVVPWSELEALIEPHYPKAGKGRPPIDLSIMLRIYFLQHWFSLSDPGAEDALYDSPALRCFAGVDLGRAAAPDETTILDFRHLLEKHDLCGKMLDAVNLYLDLKVIRISTGTIVNATIIAAPSSTKNEKKERDSQMHPTRKGSEQFREPEEMQIRSDRPGARHTSRRRLSALRSAWLHIEAAQATERLPRQATTTSLPRRSGLSRCSTEA